MQAEDSAGGRCQQLVPGREVVGGSANGQRRLLIYGAVAQGVDSGSAEDLDRGIREGFPADPALKAGASITQWTPPMASAALASSDHRG
jgi:ABC-type uncharacterized transport system ATPase subunit